MGCISGPAVHHTSYSQRSERHIATTKPILTGQTKDLFSFRGSQGLWQPLGHSQLKNSKEITSVQEFFLNVNVIIMQLWQGQKQEISSPEKITCYTLRSKRRVHAKPWGSYEKAPGQGRRQREWGKMWGRAFIVVSVGRNGQGKVNKFRIV